MKTAKAPAKYVPKDNHQKSRFVVIKDDKLRVPRQFEVRKFSGLTLSQIQ